MRGAKIWDNIGRYSVAALGLVRTHIPSKTCTAMARLTFDKAPTHYGKKSNSSTNSKITGIAHMVLSKLVRLSALLSYIRTLSMHERENGSGCVRSALVMARLTLRRLLLS